MKMKIFCKWFRALNACFYSNDDLYPIYAMSPFKENYSTIFSSWFSAFFAQMTEIMAATSSPISKEEVVKEIQIIYSHIKRPAPRNDEFILRSCRRLKEKSEHGYRGLLRLLNKNGYLNVLSDIDNALLSSEFEASSVQGNASRSAARSLSSSSAPAVLDDTNEPEASLATRERV